MTVSGLSTLVKVDKEKYFFLKIGTRSATMNLRLKQVNRRKETEPKGKSGTVEVHTKP